MKKLKDMMVIIEKKPKKAESKKQTVKQTKPIKKGKC